MDAQVTLFSEKVPELTFIKDISSTNVDLYYYDPETHCLGIVFLSSKIINPTYIYHPVTKKMFKEFTEAQSRGKWLREKVIGKEKDGIYAYKLDAKPKISEN